jgi:catechol 2,3-dioxygenase-like lactoylglutathione lyase family enzyme
MKRGLGTLVNGVLVSVAFLPIGIAFSPRPLLLREALRRTLASRRLSCPLLPLKVTKLSRMASADASDDSTVQMPPPLVLHHTALKTRNITRAVQFYSLLGYSVTTKFRAGPARAAWLELDRDPLSSHNGTHRAISAATTHARLELIEVPSYVLNERPNTQHRALDLMQRQDFLGYNHVALDVTRQIQYTTLPDLSSWIARLNETSIERFRKSLRVALEPQQQIIGTGVYELAFLFDTDGCLVELLHHQSELSQTIESGWEAWTGQGFVGVNINREE